MDVLQEILAWSQDRPEWQRDALRRLVERGNLADQDIADLTVISKGTYGLTEKRSADVLTPNHLPSAQAHQGPVRLASIYHGSGVNSLADTQTLTFGPHLTVVYGDNGAGKTGYIRMLKTACQTRGREKILGNVTSGPSEDGFDFTVTYQVDGSSLQQWANNQAIGDLGRINVFDTQSAGVYLTEKTDVAFRPFGLDLFDKLARACEAVRDRLEDEKQTLTESAIISIIELVPENTAVATLLNNLTALTKAETVEELASVSDEDHARLELLERSILDQQVPDPEKLLQELRVRGGRIHALGQHIRDVESGLSEQTIAAAVEARSLWQQRQADSERLRQTSVEENVLPGTGSELWKVLWRAARSFSEQEAYPDQAFPVTEEHARCVLCQQDLSIEAAERFHQFEAYVTSLAERKLTEAKDHFDTLRSSLTDTAITSEFVEQALMDVKLEDESTAAKIRTALTAMEDRRDALVAALAHGESIETCPQSVMVAPMVETLASQLDARADALSSQDSRDKVQQYVSEANEIRARRLLSKHLRTVLSEIERKQRIAVYDQCIAETRTNAITLKSTAVTKIVVTQKLRESFSAELEQLDFKHVEVEIDEVGGDRGVLYHKLVLTSAPGVDLPRVASEGEQRCLSIASFFSELSTAGDASAIVFDDPVSSLDYRWREGVARRIVHAAKVRQVIVFTHDVVFLLRLKQLAAEEQVEQEDRHIRQLVYGAGVCSEELPWVAMPVKKKIGYLKNQLQAAGKLHREGVLDAYEKDAKYLYGLLREAWERALEEVLLVKVVERYRPSIQTQQISKIADISVDDCRKLEMAMSKCSRWLPGHDEAAASRAPMPEPDELKVDIKTLEDWVSTINSRRN